MGHIKNDLRACIFIAGGGTGGHIFPALALADNLKDKNPYLDIIFVGSKHRMEMVRIPEAGYRIIGLDLMGWDRKNWLRNIWVMVKLLRAFMISYRLLKKMKPSIVIGVGGYTSFPLVFMAQWLRIPTLIQEQNAYAGIANRILGQRAHLICLGYKGAIRFFPRHRTLFTGNPLRTGLLNVATMDIAQARERLGLHTTRPILLIIGGSLGSARINEFFVRNIRFFEEQQIQILWQCGERSYNKLHHQLREVKGVHLMDFIEDMATAYAAADLIISRSGALAIAEICLVLRPTIFIPLPTATANHQYYNAKELADAHAAILIEEKDMEEKLLGNILSLLEDKNWQQQMVKNMRYFLPPNATEMITNKVLYLISEKALPIKKVYFVGIGGSGMRVLAQYFLRNNVSIAGYDATATQYTKALEQAGVNVFYDADPNHIDRDVDWVVYTPAIAEEHPELVYARKQNIPVVKRGFLLGHLTRGAYNICIAGTHGKTTTAAMLAQILRYTGLIAQEFIGGEQLSVMNSNASLFLERSRNTHINIIEADEYDRSFLQLSPSIAVITSMDPDHLDIYKTEEHMWEAYHHFVRRMSDDGVLLVPYHLQEQHHFSYKNIITYGIDNPKAHIYVAHIAHTEEGNLCFQVFIHDTLFIEITLQQAPLFNVENALVALTIAYILEIPKMAIQEALHVYAGVRRRFETIYKTNKIVYINDYAHHPEEVSRCVEAAKRLYPEKYMTIIFQPHLFSRTRDFYAEFAEVLSVANDIILLPIYPAREHPIEGVNSMLIAQELRCPWVLVNRSECMAYLRNHIQKVGLLLSIGAGGDLETLPNDIITILEDQKTHIKKTYK